MLHHATVVAHRGERGGEAAAVFTEAVLVRLVRCAVPVPAPTLTWRMCDDRQRARVTPGILRLVPGLYARQAKVGAVSLDEQGCDHFPPSSRVQAAAIAERVSRATQ